jgi:Tfp pilus assembly protein FimT
MSRASAAGLSLIEVLLALSLTLAAAGAAIPAMFEIDRALKLRAAAGFLTGYLQQTRLEALTRSKAVGVRFREAGGDWHLGSYADGNGNGIRTADIVTRVDAEVEPDVPFRARCPALRIARLDGVPDITGLPGGAAVRFGPGDIATFDSDGSASSGSLYVTDGRTQLAVTVTPATGRVRVRRWNRRLMTWELMR